MSIDFDKYHGTFGCYQFEETIWDQIKNSLGKKEFPDFSMYDNCEVGLCDCGSEQCLWDNETILERLKEKGVWNDVMKELNDDKVLQFSMKDFIGTLGCSNMEEEVRTYINFELKNGRKPDLSVYNEPSRGHCDCRTGSCDWNEEKIIERLKEKGIWQQVELETK